MHAFTRPSHPILRLLTASSLAFVLLAPSIALPQEPKASKSEGESSESAQTTPEEKLAAEQKDREAARKELQERKAREAARARGEYTFDDLKFDIERDAPFAPSMLNKSVLDLNKKTIRIRGYILPTSVFQQKGIKQFVLVRDNQECCFGPGALLYDCIIVEMDEGKMIDFTTRPVSVKGKIEIDTESYRYPDGKHFAIFKMKATELK